MDIMIGGDSLSAVRERSGLSVRTYRRELDQRITHDQLGLDWQGELVAGMLTRAQGSVLSSLPRSIRTFDRTTREAQ
jgi:hypothetical protein